MKRIINECNIYFAVCVLYTISGGIYFYGFLFLLVLLSLYYAIYANVHYRLPLYFKALNVLMVMFTIYGTLLLLGGERLMIKVSYEEVSNRSYLLDIYKSLLPIYAFYVFTRKGLLSEQNIKFYFFVFLLLTISSFFKNQARLLQIYGKEEFTSNLGYSFVALLPALVLFYKKPGLQYVLMALCGFFIIWAMKRGAILSGAICLIWFLYTNYKRTPKKRRWLIVAASLVVISMGVYYAQYMMNTSAYFRFRIEETTSGNSSDRNELYSVLYNHFIHEDNPLHFLLGNGANATLKIGQNYAHNDWLAIAIDEGVLGLVVYAAYWICLFLTWKKTRRQPQAFMAIGMFFIIYFLITFFSMSFSGVDKCAAMVLGYYLANMGQEEEMVVPVAEKANPRKAINYV